MADRSARNSKKPFNPLLNVSVTGATLEEFTQNAILCPAAEPVPAPVLQTVPLNNHPEENPTNSPSNFPDNQEINNQFLSQDQQQPTYQFDSYNQEYSSASTYQPQPFNTVSFNPTNPSTSESTASTLLSSFSNILSFGSQSKKETIIDEPQGPNPNSLEHLLSASGGEQTVSSIPLYSASAHNVALSGPPLPPSSLAGPKLTSSLTGPPLHGPPKSALGGQSVYSGPPPPIPTSLGISPVPTSSAGLPPTQRIPGRTLTPSISPQRVPSPVPVSGLSGPSTFSELSLSGPSIPVGTPGYFGPPGHSSNLSGASTPHSRASPGLSRPPIGLSGPTGPLVPPARVSESVFTPTASTSGFTGPGLPPLATGPSVGLCGPVESSSALSGPPVLTALSSGPVIPPEVSTSGLSGPIVPPGPSTTTVTSAKEKKLAKKVKVADTWWYKKKLRVEENIGKTETGSSNTFRRQNQKRAVYAPIPGFSSTPVSLQQGTDSNLYYPNPNENQPVATSSINPPQPSIFTPAPGPIIEFQPSNLLVPSEISEVQSLDGTPPTLLSSVMSDVSTNANPATLNSSTTLHSLGSGSPMAADMGQPKQNPALNTAPYRPVYHHWFHCRELEGRTLWIPFSMVDSLALEAAFVSTDLSPENMVATDGGRYDVNILRRKRSAVYWEGTPTEVRRCSWFYKTTNDGKFTPYEENIATKLEEEYKAAYEMNQWHRKIDLPNGETVVFQSSDILVLFPAALPSSDMWNQSPQTALRPRVVKRGMDEFDIDEGEPTKIDHLLFLVHGIGSVCDLKFRCVEEVVDDFRSISMQLVQSHYKSSWDKGLANRIEVLPVSWHNQLHSEETGIDKKLKSITLESIPRLRDFTNDTLLDILFYTSPIYSQTIISTVGTELNRIYSLFKQRNPGFKGSVSLGGHSLGSLILFDILCHQKHPEKDEDKSSDEDDLQVRRKPPPIHRRMSRRISYMMGAVGTGQPQLTYPHLNFHPIAFFALGSPIGMFVTVRGLESLGEHFALPTCPGFFNIFHPYDPVAYRVESLINPELAKYSPVLIPHHKGRKRMHLELKETVGRIGADLKQRIIDSMKNTWNSVYQMAMFHRSDKAIEAEVERVIREQERASEENDELATESAAEDEQPVDGCFGILNNGRRIDYVLQEAPFEFFNEYIFALTSHVCYWESEDTMLLILKEIYNSMHISPDNQIPPQTMTIDRSSPSSVYPDGSLHSMQMPNLMQPMNATSNQSPPPTQGFIRKT